MVKKIFFSLCILLLFTNTLEQTIAESSNMTQNSKQSYTQNWDEIKKQENAGLPKSALELVDKVFQNAQTDKNPSQIIKAIIHKIKYIGQMEEEAFVLAIEELQSQVQNADSFTKPILHSMLGDIYWQYYQSNRYYINQRTATTNFKQSDLRTYSATKLIEECIYHYTESVKDKDFLQTVSIDDYEEILNSDPKITPNGRIFRYTLLDFVGHRAVDFFMNSEPDITRPAEQFTLNQPEYFSQAEEFSKLKIETKDNLSYKYHALQILKSLVAFHLADKVPDALVDVELKRLNFVKQYYTGLESDKLYLNALETLQKKVGDIPVSSRIQHQIASYWYGQGSQYAPSNKQTYGHRKELKKAFALCETALKKFPDSIGAVDCRSLQSNIQNKSLDIRIEKINIPGKPFRAYVTYKNTDLIYFKILPVDQKLMEKIKTDYEEEYQKNYNINYQEFVVKHFAHQKGIKEFSVYLSGTKDFQTHAMETKIPELPFGQYILLASTNRNFYGDKSRTCFSFTLVTNLAYIHHTLPDNSMEFFVINRQTSEPLPNVKAKVYLQEYNSRKSGYEVIQDNSYSTDKNGYFKHASDKKYRSFFVELEHNKDRYAPVDYYFQSGLYRNTPLYQGQKYKPKNEKRVSTFLFTDRAIYRPGQQIYFKGIVVESSGKENAIQTNYPVIIILYDVNHQEVGKIDAKTNEYGSFSGTFTAPTNALKGQMQLYASTDNYHSIHVEEYKRPKFFVEFDPLTGAPQLGDMVKITGKGKAYSGANIDNAKVQYRVKRTARFPYWWFCRFGFYPSSPEMEIVSGETTTDEKGSFTIDFKAIPDLSVPQESKPVFHYQVLVDITDGTGETRSSTLTVNAGYASLLVKLETPSTLEIEKDYQLKILTTNLNHEFEPAKGYIRIYRLESPGRVFRQRLWGSSDVFLVRQKDYYKDFPNDPYREEHQYTNWKRGERVLLENFDTSKTKVLALAKDRNWKQGRYIVEIVAKDQNDRETKEVSYVTVTSQKSKEIPFTEAFWYKPNKTKFEPGEKASIQLGSSEPIRVLYEVGQNNKVISREWKSLTSQRQSIEIPIQEDHRGNLWVNFTYIVHNRVYTHSQTIEVPYTNKQLDVSFETFRNKLQPGEKEEWRLKIRGPKGEKVAAEMLASLYDASLDAFRSNDFYFSIYPSYHASSMWSSNGDFTARGFSTWEKDWNVYISGYGLSYDTLNWFGVYLSNFRGFYPHHFYPQGVGSTRRLMKSARKMKEKSAEREEGDADEEVMAMEDAPSSPPPPPAEAPAAKPQAALAGKDRAADKAEPSPEEAGPDLAGVKARTNFNETAFFYPHLQTDSDGSIIIQFTIPEALTKWKMIGLTHTKDLMYGLTSNELITQKELMVVPGVPRFFREGDEIHFSTKVTNLSDKEQTGQAKLELFDSVSMKPLTETDKNPLTEKAIQNFTAKAGQSTSVSWKLKIPEGVSAITYRVVAVAGQFSDGEEMAIPVLTNRMLVTESIPLHHRGNKPKTFTLDKLLKNSSTTLKHHKLTLEYTANPAWYAIQALPYIMEYPYECAEQVFSRYYANSLATHIANSSPKIKKVFDEWKSLKSGNKEAFYSNLEKNQELKSLLLEETPWVLQAEEESERKKRIGILFDLNRMSGELERALEKLRKTQGGNGGFPWFAGMPEDRYISQHIASGMGHLDHLGIKSIRENKKVWQMIEKLVGYLDSKLRDDYENLLRLEGRDKYNLSEQYIGYIQIHYLYMRSFFAKDFPIAEENREAFEYYKWQAKTYWTKFLNQKMLTGMIALSLKRLGEETDPDYQEKLKTHKLTDFAGHDTPQKVIDSLNEHALHSEEMGMYWKADPGFHWYQLPVETQSLLIEVYQEITGDLQLVNDLRTWLLKQKQTTDWKTTKATSEAIYALLLKGDDWLATEPQIKIELGNTLIEPAKDKNLQKESGTGYFKLSYPGDQVTNAMGKVSIIPIQENKILPPSWGGLYWQYFEQLDKITPHATPLNLQKQLFLQKNSPTGPVLTPVTSEEQLLPGDLLKVRIELRVDRDMEYVHLKDMRASGFEPINVLSSYKWQEGLGYYESTGDAATNFFISYLPKGTYVFEYPLRVTHKGDFSNGVTTIQCMYAPEFSSHSEGIRVKVGE
ncbi:MAG: hypothetical protein H7A23_04965 [Leptospiraceae bacterium]|nr:hypothetical protein [Leptospiraceae bacterium]